MHRQMRYYDNSPKRGVFIRLEFPAYDHLKEQAKLKGISLTELCKQCLINGMGRDKYEMILEQAKGENNI